MLKIQVWDAFFLEFQEASQFLTHLIDCQGCLSQEPVATSLQMRFFPMTISENFG